MSFVGAANSQIQNTNDWHPNTRILDEGTKHPNSGDGSSASTLAHDVKKFYELLRDKKWHQTYELRAKAFREVMLETDYLAEGLKYENKWGLVNYEVLAAELENSDTASQDMDTAILICKFTELPGNTVSYSTVYWHREDGVWKCLSAGPKKLFIFDGLKRPEIDWR